MSQHATALEPSQAFIRKPAMDWCLCMMVGRLWMGRISVWQQPCVGGVKQR